MDTSKLNKRKLEEQVEIDDEKIKKAEFYKEKGNELYKQSMYDEALDYYFKSITLNPKDHRCYGNIGQILIQKARYPEAKEVLQAAIELNSNYAKAYYRLGLVEKYLKNYDEALRNFDKVLKLEPNNKAIIKEYDAIQSFGKPATAKERNVTLADKLSSNALDVRQLNSSNVKSSSLSTNSTNVKSSSLSTKSHISNTNTNSIRSTNSNKPPNSIKNITFPTTIHIPPLKLPDTLPKTSYQFNVVWREIKDSKSRIEYLTFVGADHFLKLFKKNLEPDFLSELIALFPAMDKSLVVGLLNSITKIDTFDFVIMFLSKAEKESLKQLISSADCDSNKLNALFKL